MLTCSFYAFLYGIMRAYFAKGFRSFHTGSVRSSGQRAAKLLTFKVDSLKKSLPLGSGPNPTSWPEFEFLGSNHSQSLMAGIFAALLPTDSIFLVWEDLNQLEKIT